MAPGLTCLCGDAGMQAVCELPQSGSSEIMAYVAYAVAVAAEAVAAVVVDLYLHGFTRGSMISAWGVGVRRRARDASAKGSKVV